MRTLKKLRPSRRSMSMALVGLFLTSSLIFLSAGRSYADGCPGMPDGLQTWLPLFDKTCENFLPKPGNFVYDALNDVAKFISRGVSGVLKKMADEILLISNPRVGLHSQGFLQQYQVGMGIGIALLIPLVLISVVQALMRGSASTIIRLFVIQIPIAIIGGFLAVYLVDASIMMFDAFARAAAPGFFEANGPIVLMLKNISQASLATGTFVIVGVIGGVMTLVAAFAVFVELMARHIMILVTLVFVPMAFAGMVWPITQRWFGKSLRIIFSLILSKLFLVVLFSVGAVVINESVFADSAGQNAINNLPFTPYSRQELSDGCASRNDYQACVRGIVSGTAKKALSVEVGNQIHDKCEQLSSSATLVADKKALYFGCWQTQLSSASDIDYVKNQWELARADNGSASIGGLFAGIAILSLAAFSPAIVYKMFDIFEGGIEQVRYVRKGATVSPATRAANYYTPYLIVDKLSRERISTWWTKKP